MTVTVPEDAVPGYHPAGVVVALATDSGGVSVTHRIGVRLHVEVTGDLTPALALPDVEATFTRSWVPFTPGTLHLEHTVVNDGNTRLGATVDAEVTGPAGLAGAGPPGDAAELLPGDTATRSVDATAWPLGVLDGDLTATALTIGQDSTPLPEPVVVSIRAVAIPWLELVVALAVAGLVVLLLRRRAAHP